MNNNRVTAFRSPAWNRRQVLQMGLAAGTAAVTGATASPASQDPSPAGGWIDAHVHVWTPDLARFPLAEGFQKQDMQPPSFTPQELMSHAAPCGVTRVVLIQMSYYRYDNRYMLDVMQRHPGVYSGVAIVDPRQRPRERMHELAKQGVRGFRIQPHDQAPDAWLNGEGMQAMWACGADEQLAMCRLINPEFLPSVDRMCRQYPRTPVVIDHFARIGIDGAIRPRDLDSLCRLADHDQVRVKVSAFYALGAKKPPYHDLGPMIRRLLQAFGRERLMWASDCPFQVQGEHTYAKSIDLIRHGLEFLDDQDRQWLLRKTAETTFFRA